VAQKHDEDTLLRSVALQNASAIFAQRRREDELRARLAAVVESTDDAIITKSLDGIIDTWNQGAERMFGYQAEEVVGKPITILIPQERLSEETEILDKIRRGLRIEYYETVRVCKDGARLDVGLAIAPIRDAQGVVIGASKIARDITTRKQMEEALRESEARLRGVVEATPECVIIVSPKGGLVFINPAGLGMIEADTVSSVEGICVYDLVAPEHRHDWVERHVRICGGASLNWEFEIVGLKGTRRWMETRAVPLTLMDGRIGQLAVTREITARKRAEAEREQLLINERTARAEAERASLLKDEFLATLSHELRTPLNAILGWSSILRSRGYNDQELTQGLSVIERNTRAQAQLIEDMLDMSRIISGKTRLDIQQVDLENVVKAAVASVRHSADAKEIHLDTVIDPQAGLVRGDPGRLQQCLWNLLSNAIKFTPKGGKVQVVLRQMHSSIEVSVIDTGEGISPEFLPHVFERFRQADASTTRRHGGLGLGLSIVKHLVELHGGKVRAQSSGEGQGSSFTVGLPVLAVQPYAISGGRDYPGSPASTVGSGEPVSLEGITVLAVDDDLDARNLLKHVLESCGARVVLAASAREAIKLVLSERPDMIISDIGMPGEDGYEFIRKVRALSADKGGRTPAAALTAFARAEDRTRALRAGYQMHAAKPIEPAELTAVVASLASRR
jgi:PAS domain S-box-containing protein